MSLTAVPVNRVGNCGSEGLLSPPQEETEAQRSPAEGRWTQASSASTPHLCCPVTLPPMTCPASCRRDSSKWSCRGASLGCLGRLSARGPAAHCVTLDRSPASLGLSFPSSEKAAVTRQDRVPSLLWEGLAIWGPHHLCSGLCAPRSPSGLRGVPVKPGPLEDSTPGLLTLASRDC